MDETQHRLIAWTDSQHSERLAAQVLAEEGYKDIDPSHPYGGPDGGRDISCTKDGRKWIGAVYFPRGPQSFADIKRKLRGDILGAKKHSPDGLVFVTNQEIPLGDRLKLARVIPAELDFDLIHMERVATVLDRPHMHRIREQFLHLPADPVPLDIRIGFVGTAYCFTDSEELRDTLIERDARQVRAQAQKSKASLMEASRGIRNLGQLTADPTMFFKLPDPSQSRYISEAEAEEYVEGLTANMHENWSRSEQIIAERAFNCIGFTVSNLAESFLTNVEIVLTFHGAQGFEEESSTTDFEQLVMDPDHEPSDMWLSAAANSLPKRMGSDPVQFENTDAGSLEVTITLPQLRPAPARWKSGSDEFIVFAPGPGPVAVTWYLTADGYGRSLERGFDDDGRAPLEIAVTTVDTTAAYNQVVTGR